MAHTDTLCPKCGIGNLKCSNTSRLKLSNKHPLEQPKVSAWQCDNKDCNKYFKLYTPVGELINVVKRVFTRRKEKNTTGSQKLCETL